VLNFGKHQKRASRRPADRSYWGTPELQLALSSHPHIVVVQFGTNDVAVEEEWDEDAFRRDYGDLLAAFMRLPSRPSVYVCVPPPLYETDEGCDGDGKDEDKPRRCWFKPMLNTVLPDIVAWSVLSFPTRIVYLYGILPLPAFVFGVGYLLSETYGLYSGNPTVANVAHLGGAAVGGLWFFLRR
jgi:hypothetical protein